MKRILRNNYLILVPILILNVISLFYLYNSSYFVKQFIFVIVSNILLLVISRINVRWLSKYIKISYYITLLLLILVLFVGREINGSKAWLHVFGISIQPSEICKLVLCVYVSYLVMDGISLFRLLLVILIPSILTFLEPDTGAIIIYGIILVSCIKYSNISKKTVNIGIFIIVLFCVFNVYLYFNNQELFLSIYGNKIFYRIDRLISFKEQSNIQTTNSLISIGAHRLLYIPENHNDFIFASIISLYSPLVFIIILICYLVIFIYYLFNINNKKNISNIYNFSILNILLFQVFYNVLMNLSLVPIIGIPLPFLSYGGSYLICLYVSVGLSINYLRKKVDMVDEVPFHTEDS